MAMTEINLWVQAPQKPGSVEGESGTPLSVSEEAEASEAGFASIMVAMSTPTASDATTEELQVAQDANAAAADAEGTVSQANAKNIQAGASRSGGAALLPEVSLGDVVPAPQNGGTHAHDTGAPEAPVVQPGNTRGALRGFDAGSLTDVEPQARGAAADGASRAAHTGAAADDALGSARRPSFVERMTPVADRHPGAGGLRSEPIQPRRETPAGETRPTSAGAPTAQRSGSGTETGPGFEARTLTESAAAVTGRAAGPDAARRLEASTQSSGDAAAVEDDAESRAPTAASRTDRRGAGRDAYASSDSETASRGDASRLPKPQASTAQASSETRLDLMRPVSASDLRTATTLPVSGGERSPGTGAVVRHQVVEEALRLVRLGQRRAEIVLEPPELGRVRLHLNVTGHSIHGSIEAESAAVVDALKAELSHLMASFNEQGLDADGLRVTLLDEQSAQPRRERQEREQRRPERRAEDTQATGPRPGKTQVDSGALDYLL